MRHSLFLVSALSEIKISVHLCSCIISQIQRTNKATVETQELTDWMCCRHPGKNNMETKDWIHLQIRKQLKSTWMTATVVFACIKCFIHFILYQLAFTFVAHYSKQQGRFRLPWCNTTTKAVKKKKKTEFIRINFLLWSVSTSSYVFIYWTLKWIIWGSISVCYVYAGGVSRLSFPFNMK